MPKAPPHTETIPDKVQKLLETADTLTNPDAKYVEWLYNVKAFAQTEALSELEKHTDTAIQFSEHKDYMQEYKDKIVGFLNATYINPITGSVTEQIETLLVKIPLTLQNLTKNHLRENHCIEHLSIYFLNNAFTYNTAPVTGAVLVNYPRFQDAPKESLL